VIAGTIVLILGFATIQLSKAPPPYIPETLFVSFTGGPYAATTVNQYSGTVWIYVSGNGTAAGTQWSDAFYVYTTSAGVPLQPPGVIGLNNPLHPWHCDFLLYNWVLWINGQHAENLMPGGIASLPAYNPSHQYVFTISLPSATTLTFGVGDTGAWDNSGNYDIVVSTVPLNAATFDIGPGTLKLKSLGQFITCYIELPPGYNINDIDPSSIRLEGTIPKSGSYPPPDDYDSDGIPDQQVKFSRSAVNSLLISVGALASGYATLTVTFSLNNGTLFAGDDYVNVRGCGVGPSHRL